jgi:hypothetical protein
MHTTSRMQLNDYVALEGPVERRGDRLVFRVPLEAGGDRLRLVAKATSYEEDGNLVVVLPEWLAHRMQLDEGSAVHVDDRCGKLNIARLN